MWKQQGELCSCQVVIEWAANSINIKHIYIFLCYIYADGDSDSGTYQFLKYTRKNDKNQEHYEETGILLNNYMWQWQRKWK